MRRNPCHCPTRAHKSFHLTCAQFMDLINRAGNQCECCGKAGEVGIGAAVEALHLDHDPALGFTAVRGLVCRTCNMKFRRLDNGKREPTPMETRYIARAFHKTIGATGECPPDCQWVKSHHGRKTWLTETERREMRDAAAVTAWATGRQDA